MKRTMLMAAFLATLYFLMAFNAYACLIPLYGNAQMEKGSGCAMPKEPPVRDACDAFKAIGIQGLSSAHPLPDCYSQVAASAPTSASMPAPLQSCHYKFSDRPPLLDRDPLSLTSILRI